MPPWRTDDEQALALLAGHEFRANGARGYPLHEPIARMAAVLRSEHGLVDSVRVGSANRMVT